MAESSNDFQTIKPITKESYSGKAKKKAKFDKLRKKILKDWKPKKIGL